jgi:hypothetical protein
MFTTYLLYFVTVILPGTVFLIAAYRYDKKHVPVGENFMPTMEELRLLKKEILG